jgi:MinD-like ATPase involved in chromosome partitioning or flagellar assembly
MENIMKITFWSPVHGQTKTTSNMIAIAIYSTILLEQNIMIMQSNFNLNNLEIPLVGTHTKVVGEYFNGDIGLDALARSIKSEPLNKEVIHNCSISMLNQGLNLLPGTTKLNREHYEDKLIPVLPSIIHSIEQHYDMVFIDTNSGMCDEITKRVIQMSDIIVVNLCQSKAVLEEYFAENPLRELENKIFYLLGSYDKKSMYSVTNIKRIYKNYLKNNIAVIPYNTKYMDSISSGKTISYMESCLEHTKLEDNKYFTDCVKEASKRILLKAGMNRRIIT